MIKKLVPFLCLVLVMSVAAGALADTAGIRGYTKKEKYQYVTFGAYFTQADGTKEPILWRVLTAGDGEAWLLSEYILFGSPCHGDYEHYKGWVESDLYHYLNEVFIHDALSAEEQAALLIRTEDEALVTLLTPDDMRNADIGFDTNKDRLCESTAWAKILQDPPLFEIPKSNNKGRWKPLYILADGHKYSPWWSRERSRDYAHEQRYCFYQGKIGRISSGNTDIGVRPTVFLDLSRVDILSGEGTFDMPFVLAPLPNAGAD